LRSPAETDTLRFRFEGLMSAKAAFPSIGNLNMNISEYWKMDLDHLWHPYTRFSALADGPLPLLVRGHGLYLQSADGKQYLDAIASWWSCALGHGHPAIVEAIRAQAAELPHSILGNLSHPRAVELAAQLASFFEDPRRHVLFASDGASAVEAALKIAAQYWRNVGQTNRTRFAALQNAYHGDTLGAVSVGYLEGFHSAFRPLLTPAITLPVPHRDADEHACRKAAQEMFARTGETMAALIVEPLCLCAAGMKMYSAGYLEYLAELCRLHHVLLIVDEIATGFGRTGRWFAFEHADIDPDIVCLGKALTGGALPLSATVVKDAVYATFDDRTVDRTFYHGHTFCGNPIAAAAALAALRVYRDINAPDRAQAISRAFCRAWEGLRVLDHIADVRVLGAIGAVEFKEPSTPVTAAQEEAIPRVHQIRKSLLAQGILVRPLGNVVYLFPPLTMTAAEAENLAQILADAVRHAAQA
jgi:adenosylmethionine-8-amino-7-oxononanoate aminotransferase